MHRLCISIFVIWLQKQAKVRISQEPRPWWMWAIAGCCATCYQCICLATAKPRIILILFHSLIIYKVIIISYHNNNTIKKKTSIQFQVVFFDFHSSGAENARHSVSSCLDGPSASVWTQFAVNSPHSQFPSQFASSSFLHSQIAHNFSQIVVQNQKYKNSSPFLPTVESRLAQPPMVGEWWPSKAKANSLARIFWRLTGISDPNRKRPKTITSLVPTHFQNRNKFQRITPV